MKPSFDAIPYVQRFHILNIVLLTSLLLSITPPLLSQDDNPTPTATEIHPATATQTEMPTATFTAIPTETPTTTFSETPSETATETATNTETATETATEALTPTETATETSVETPSETATLVETATLSPETVTPSATEALLPTPSRTAIPTATFVPALPEAASAFSLQSEGDTDVTVSTVEELKQAIEAANDAPDNLHVIRLQPGYYTRSTRDPDSLGISSSGLPPILSPITLIGLGARPEDTVLNRVLVPGTEGQPDSYFTILTVLAPGNLTLINVTVRGGGGDTPQGGLAYGGGLVNHGVLLARNSIIEDNTAQLGGGGIFNADDATLQLDTVVMRNNRAGVAGGIQNQDQASVFAECVRFDANVAGYAGALWQIGSGSVSVMASRFYGNTSTTFGGGAIFNETYLSDQSISVAAVPNYWWGEGVEAPVKNGGLEGSGYPSVDTISDGVVAEPGYVTYDLTTDPQYCNFWEEELPPTPTATATPSLTPTPIPTFTNIDFYGEDVELQGVIFWVIYWETLSDSSDSGSPADYDLTQAGLPRYTEFLFDQQQPYCSPGANPPSDNAAESIIVPNPMDPSDPYWLYIKHCPRDHRFMFARTMMNGFLNYERRNTPPFNYVLGNNSGVTSSAETNRLWVVVKN